MYITEAHTNQLKKLGCNAKPPKTLAERAAVARQGVKTLKITLPVLMSDMAGEIEKVYTPWPSRACIVDSKGKIVYISRAAPNGIKVKEIERELKQALK